MRDLWPGLLAVRSLSAAQRKASCSGGVTALAVQQACDVDCLNSLSLSLSPSLSPFSFLPQGSRKPRPRKHPYRATSPVRSPLSPWDPTVGLCLGPYGRPRGVAFSCGPGTPVSSAEFSLQHLYPARGSITSAARELQESLLPLKT